jgi:hypothetical protein
MPLKIADVPTVAHEAVRTRLSHVAGRAAFGTPAMRRASPDALALSAPHRIAVLALDRITPDMSIRKAARKKGWRYLVHDGDQVAAAADTVVSEAGEHSFGHLNEGPFVQGTEQAIRRAEALEVVRRGSFEPLLLMVPAIYVVALWLEDLAGDADWFMAIPPAPRELAPYQAVASGDLVAALNTIVARMGPDAGP